MGPKKRKKIEARDIGRARLGPAMKGDVWPDGTVVGEETGCDYQDHATLAEVGDREPDDGWPMDK